MDHLRHVPEYNKQYFDMYWRTGGVISCWGLRLHFMLRNGQNRVHPEAQWPKPGTPFHASPVAPSYWPTPAQTRLWPNLKRVHPILATHPPIGYPISITPIRLWPGYSTSSPHAHASSQDAAGHFCGRGGRACGRTLNLLCSLYVMRLSLTRVTKSYLLALRTTQISSYFTKH